MTKGADAPVALQPRIDCHVHVLDPARFAYTADAYHRPAGAEIATATQLGLLLDAHGVRHALIVGPNSGYGPDNRCLLDALRLGAGRYKGIAVVRNDAGIAELQELQASGVVGAAFNASLLGVDAYRDIGSLLGRLRDLNMWAQFQVRDDQLAALRALIMDSGVRLLFDHCGRPDIQAGLGQAGFAALLAMADTGRACVKLSGYAKYSALPHPHADVRPYVQALIAAYTPQNLVWASDWPFLHAPARIDYGPLLALFEDLLPGAAARHAVMWESPRRLFGFGG